MEQIFSVPGLGTTLISSITQRDYPMVQGAILLTGLAFILVQLLVDLSLYLPRSAGSTRMSVLAPVFHPLPVVPRIQLPGLARRNLLGTIGVAIVLVLGLVAGWPVG